MLTVFICNNSGKDRSRISSGGAGISVSCGIFHYDFSRPAIAIPPRIIPSAKLLRSLCRHKRQPEPSEDHFRVGEGAWWWGGTLAASVRPAYLQMDLKTPTITTAHAIRTTPRHPLPDAGDVNLSGDAARNSTSSFSTAVLASTSPMSAPSRYCLIASIFWPRNSASLMRVNLSSGIGVFIGSLILYMRVAFGQSTAELIGRRRGCHVRLALANILSPDVKGDTAARGLGLTDRGAVISAIPSIGPSSHSLVPDELMEATIFGDPYTALRWSGQRSV